MKLVDFNLMVRAPRLVAESRRGALERTLRGGLAAQAMITKGLAPTMADFKKGMAE